MNEIRSATAQPLPEAIDLTDQRSDSSPEGALALKGEMEEVSAALAQLAPQQREAVVLRYLGDQSYREMSQQLGRSESSIRSAVCRGLARLRKITGQAL